MSERSHSVYVEFYDTHGEVGAVEEYRAFTTEDEVPGHVLEEYALEQMYEGLDSVQWIDRDAVVRALLDGSRDFVYPNPNNDGSHTRFKVEKDLPPSRFLVSDVEEDEETYVGYPTVLGMIVVK
jgi:hypothetical protein